MPSGIMLETRLVSLDSLAAAFVDSLTPNSFFQELIVYFCDALSKLPFIEDLLSGI